MKLTKEDLIAFEKEIFDLYKDGKIKGVIHLSGSEDGRYEDELIALFQGIQREDWVFSNHRNHYHLLLKAGKAFCKANIVKGESMTQFSRRHKVFTSGIVGGQIPIALGVALSLRLKKERGHVWCFVGEMASEMGTFHVCYKYALANDLPMTFVVENNEFSIYTPTDQVWGTKGRKFSSYVPGEKVISLKYTRKYPHHGVGTFVHF